MELPRGRRAPLMGIFQEHLLDSYLERSAPPPSAIPHFQSRA